MQTAEVNNNSTAGEESGPGAGSALPTAAEERGPGAADLSDQLDASDLDDYEHPTGIARPLPKSKPEQKSSGTLSVVKRNSGKPEVRAKPKMAPKPTRYKSGALKSTASIGGEIENKQCEVQNQHNSGANAETVNLETDKFADGNHSEKSGSAEKNDEAIASTEQQHETREESVCARGSLVTMVENPVYASSAGFVKKNLAQVGRSDAVEREPGETAASSETPSREGDRGDDQPERKPSLVLYDDVAAPKVSQRFHTE